MAVSADNRRTQIDIVGGETSLTYTFGIDDADEIDVVRNRAGVLTVFTISATSPPVSGKFFVDSGFPVVKTIKVLGSDMISGDDIVIEGNRDITRVTDYTGSGDFFAATVNTEQDKVTQILQELQRDISRSMRLSDGEVTVVDMTLPTPLEAGAVIGLNSAGTGIEFYSSATGTVDLNDLGTTGAVNNDVIQFNSTSGDWERRQDATFAAAVTVGTTLGVTGLLTGASATLSGTLTAATGTVTGAATVGTTLGVGGLLTGTTATFTGLLTAATATFSGNVTFGDDLTVGVDDATSPAGGAFIDTSRPDDDPIDNVLIGAAYFSNVLMTTWANYAVKQTRVGQTSINTASGKKLMLAVNGTEELTITAGNALFECDVDIEGGVLEVTNTGYSVLRLTDDTGSPAGGVGVAQYKCLTENNGTLQILSIPGIIEFFTESISGRALTLDASQNATFTGDVTIGLHGTYTDAGALIDTSRVYAGDPSADAIKGAAYFSNSAALCEGWTEYAVKQTRVGQTSVNTVAGTMLRLAVNGQEHLTITNGLALFARTGVGDCDVEITGDLDVTGDATFTGNIAVTSASSPEVAVTDSANTVTGTLRANSGGVQVGSMTAGKELQIFSRNAAVLSFGLYQAATFTDDVDVGGDLDVAGDVQIEGDLNIKEFLSIGDGLHTWVALDTNGKLTPTKSKIEVTTFGNTNGTDDCTHIAAGTEGQILILGVYNNSRTVTYKHVSASAGLGERILLPGGVEFTPTERGDQLTLVWSQIYHHPNGGWACISTSVNHS